MYKIAICDDDKHYINIIRLLIEKRMLCDTKIYEYLSGEQLINNAEENHNLIFLDIQMDKMDGNEVAKLIRQKNESAVLVFCTGTQMPTPESFKVQPFRYILKSSDNRLLIDEIDEIINEMIKRLEMVYYNAIFDGQVQRIPIKDILYITLDKYGSTIVLDKRLYEKEDAKYIKSREKLNSIYMRLNKYGFEYAHNSYIVNFKHIMSIFKQEIVLDDKTILNISRSKKKNFDEKFAEFLNVNFNRKRGEKI